MVKPCPRDPKERAEYMKKLDKDFDRTMVLFGIAVIVALAIFVVAVFFR